MPREVISFSAALLVGGRSSRMGRDKALLRLPNSSHLIWERQLGVLGQLDPQEILWSGPPRPGMPASVRVVEDQSVNAGPLAGVSACLDAMQSDLLIVLAVDLPNITLEFLMMMLAFSSLTCGAVASHGDFFEPLAAIYPKGLNVLAREHLAQKRYAMQDFVREAIRINRLKSWVETDGSLFKNLNSPADLEDPGAVD